MRSQRRDLYHRNEYELAYQYYKRKPVNRGYDYRNTRPYRRPSPEVIPYFIGGGPKAARLTRPRIGVSRASKYSRRSYPMKRTIALRTRYNIPYSYQKEKMTYEERERARQLENEERRRARSQISEQKRKRENALLQAMREEATDMFALQPPRRGLSKGHSHQREKTGSDQRLPIRRNHIKNASTAVFAPTSPRNLGTDSTNDMLEEDICY